MKGFTLIETIIYLTLFSILMGGAVVAAFNLFEGAGREQTRAMLQEEGQFIIGKIDWALAHGLTVSLSGTGDVLIQDGGSYALNNSNVTVTHLSFVHMFGTGSGVNPESMAASTTLTARTSEGIVLSEDFSTIKYVHH